MQKVICNKQFVKMQCMNDGQMTKKIFGIREGKITVEQNGRGKESQKRQNLTGTLKTICEEVRKEFRRERFNQKLKKGNIMSYSRQSEQTSLAAVEG